MHSLEKIKDMLMNELDKCAEKNSVSGNSLYLIDKLTHAVKSIDTILAMEEAGYSNDGYSYARGRRRDSMGRYSRNYGGGRMYYDDYHGYSRDDARDDLVNQLREIAMDAHDEESRGMIENWIRQAEQK